jgi:ribulose-phosphate 3-epimerase
MTSNVRVAPSILSADFAKLGEEVEALYRAGADMIHVDIMDGHFVPNITFGADLMRAIRPCADVPFDVHLMIAPAEPYVEGFRKAGADCITVHVEAETHIHRTLQRVRDLGATVGIALNPGTPVEALDPVLDLVDRVLVMTVNPGFGGQAFLTSQLAKIRAVRARAQAAGRQIDVEVDGGIAPGTVGPCVAAGADLLAAGSSVFKGGPEQYAANIRALREAATTVAA